MNAGFDFDYLSSDYVGFGRLERIVAVVGRPWSFGWSRRLGLIVHFR